MPIKLNFVMDEIDDPRPRFLLAQQLIHPHSCRLEEIRSVTLDQKVYTLPTCSLTLPCQLRASFWQPPIAPKRILEIAMLTQERMRHRDPVMYTRIPREVSLDVSGTL